MSVIFRNSGFTVELENESEVRLARNLGLRQEAGCAENRHKLYKMESVAKINRVKFCLPISCLYLMRILYFGDRKVRVGRMENRDWVEFTIGKYEDFFQVLLEGWAQAIVTY